ncbi:hypothetical protein GCK32_013089 [Trichostrongylus colubriformis]|uniref:Partial AB-hydrolase lipase domain-containing protein n=2 Tax=Trichostrongylus colubriformis TaxID=6319 RepID=A0AAN8IR18_TRICO
MFPLAWATAVLSFGVPLVFCEDPEIEMTVPEIIRYWGYPVEIHYAVTQDGYILELHRIPYGKAGPTSNISRPVIFLQHGLESSSSCWKFPEHMIPLFVLATVLLSHVDSFPSWFRYDPEIKMTVPEIIRYWGYPVEVHYAVTRDGYILELHRIPYGKAGPTTNTARPVVFLQHGLESSSSDWVTNLPEQAAGGRG